MTMHVMSNSFFYNTETAKLVASGGDNEWSEAGWHVYQTPRGSYFKVSYGHEGEERGFCALDYAHAQELIAKHPVVCSQWGRAAVELS
jgi:hypothetical protein